MPHFYRIVSLQTIIRYIIGNEIEESLLVQIIAIFDVVLLRRNHSQILFFFATIFAKFHTADILLVDQVGRYRILSGIVPGAIKKSSWKITIFQQIISGSLNLRCLKNTKKKVSFWPAFDANFWFDGKIEIEGKTRQTTENKQTFDLKGAKGEKNEIEEKTRQNTVNKQTFDITDRNALRTARSSLTNVKWEFSEHFQTLCIDVLPENFFAEKKSPRSIPFLCTLLFSVLFTLRNRIQNVVSSGPQARHLVK